jgi:hypothetical protein
MLEVAFGVAMMLAWPAGLIAIRVLWRRGRITDRTAAAAGLLLLPVFVAAVVLVQSKDVGFTALIALPLFGISALWYRLALGLMAGMRDVSRDTIDPLSGMSGPARLAIWATIASPALLVVAVFVWLSLTHRI